MPSYLTGAGWIVLPDLDDERKVETWLTADQITTLNAAIAAGTISAPAIGTVIRLSASGSTNGTAYSLKGVGTAAAFSSAVEGGGSGGASNMTVGPDVTTGRSFAVADANTLVPLVNADLTMTIPLGLAGPGLNTLFSCVVALTGTPGFTFPSGVTVNGVAGPSTLYRAASAGNQIALTGIAANKFLLNGVDVAQPVDPDFTAFMTRVTANSGTVSTATQNAYKTLIASLKAAGVVNATDIPRLNMVAGNELAASRVPLIVNGVFNTGSPDTVIGTGSYSEAQGWGTDGTTTAYDTGYIPTTATGMMGFYSGVAVPDSAIHYLMGTTDAGNTQHFGLMANTGATGSNTYNSFRSKWGAPYASASPVQAGGGIDAAWWIGGRLATSGTNSSAQYKNATGAGQSSTVASGATPGVSMYVMAVNGGGTAGGFCASAMKCRGYGIFGPLDATKEAAIYNAIQAFNTTLGRQV